MRIGNLDCATVNARTRASAKVEWEDCDRPAREVYFETGSPLAADIRANPNAFLLAAFVPALYNGERRIAVEGALCPRLRDGIESAMKLFGYWYGIRASDPMTIEASGGFVAPRKATEAGVASTMSGGVDALATLRRNRAWFPPDHPLSLRTCFLIHGIDVGGYVELPGAEGHFEETRDVLVDLARREHFALCPVYTNLRHLDDSDAIFASMWFGAALAAVAHAFAPRVSTLLIPSGNSIDEQGSQGSHPLLDPWYSSAETEVIHDGFGLSRLEKVALICKSDNALGSLRSCYHPFREPGQLNCGKCEKCLRTMTALLIHGKLAACPTFGPADLEPADLEALLPSQAPLTPQSVNAFLAEMPPLLGDHSVQMWREMIEPLECIGRHDLARVVRRKTRQFARHRLLRKRGRDCRRIVVDLDGHYLGGIMRRSYRRLRRRS